MQKGCQVPIKPKMETRIFTETQPIMRSRRPSVPTQGLSTISFAPVAGHEPDPKAPFTMLPPLPSLMSERSLNPMPAGSPYRTGLPSATVAVSSVHQSHLQKTELILNNGPVRPETKPIHFSCLHFNRHTSVFDGTIFLTPSAAPLVDEGVVEVGLKATATGWATSREIEAELDSSSNTGYGESSKWRVRFRLADLAPSELSQPKPTVYLQLCAFARTAIPTSPISHSSPSTQFEHWDSDWGRNYHVSVRPLSRFEQDIHEKEQLLNGVVVKRRTSGSGSIAVQLGKGGGTSFVEQTLSGRYFAVELETDSVRRAWLRKMDSESKVVNGVKCGCVI